jgi:hypothetical protein
LCHDPREDEVSAACGHSFCRSCVAEFIDTVDRVSMMRRSMSNLKSLVIG